jgi:two-component sensor histidine kinase
MWFRPEKVEEVRWAGDPHKAVEAEPGARLNPRTSFEGWKQTVRGRARAWTQAELEAAADFRRRLLTLRRQHEAHADVQRLTEVVASRDEQLAQKDFLLKEVNHRIQNNLQLVASFLSLQRRETADPVLRAHLDEATRRMRAVGLVHRRLYHSDVVETVEMHRYLEELTGELVSSLGPEWNDMLELDAAPADVATDRAVALGLVLTELVINIAKYAYEGRPGPISVTFAVGRRELELAVADQGRGRPPGADGDGFGTRMMKALVAQLGGALRYIDNQPGARAVLTAPTG